MNDQKKKRRGMVLVLCVILAALLLLAWWQRNNITALVRFFSHSRQELEEKLAENDQAIRDAVENDPDLTIRPITPDEQEALRNGTLTMEQLPERLKKPWEPLPEPEKPEEPPKEETSPYQTALNDIVANVYVLREEYLMELENLQRRAVEAYQNLPADSSRKEFAREYLDAAVALEEACDQKMDGIVAELRALLKANQKSLELVDTIKFTYANEKSLKKAWYISELQRRGFI